MKITRSWVKTDGRSIAKLIEDTGLSRLGKQNKFVTTRPNLLILYYVTIATQKLGEIETAFEECFRHAIDMGQISSAHNPQQLARFVMTVNQGLRVASRSKATKQQLDEVVSTTISLLGLAA